MARPWVATPSTNSTTEEYRRLLKAIQLDKHAALKATSWGAFQIMGEHYAALEFATVEDFVKYVSHSARNQIQIFAKACKLVDPRWKSALQKNDWVKFAMTYNGPEYKKNNYDKKLRDTYQKLMGKEE